MAEGSDAIAADLERKRDALRSRAERLERRVRDDIDQAGDEAKARAQQLVDRAREAAGPDSVLGRHPVATVAGAGAAGVALGVASNHDDDDGRYRLPPHEKHDFQRDEERAKQARRDDQRSRNGSVAKKGASVLSGLLGAEIANVLRDFAGGVIRGSDGREHTLEDQEGNIRRADLEPAASNGRSRMGAEVAPKDHTVDELAASGSRSERPVEWQGHTYTPGADDSKPGIREGDASPATPTATRAQSERRIGVETAAHDHTVDDLAASGSRTQRPVEWQGHPYTPGSDETKPGARE